MSLHKWLKDDHNPTPNSKVRGLDIAKHEYFNDVQESAAGKCNGNCSDEEMNNYLEEALIAWMNSWNTGLGLYKGIRQPEGNYNWSRIN